MILALECSASRASVALVSDSGLVREVLAEAPRGRGGALFSALQEVLAGGELIEKVVVGTGPGSYNGIRSALAAGWGIATTRGVPMVGISSLLGLGEGSYVALGDARRGQFYWAVVEDGCFREDPVLLEAADLPAALARYPEYPRFVPSLLKEVPAEVRLPSAALLAVRAVDLVPQVGIPEPLYLKPAYINLPGMAGAPTSS